MRGRYRGLLPVGFAALLVLIPAGAQAERGFEITPFAGFRFGGSFEDNTTGTDFKVGESGSFGLILGLRDTPDHRQREAFVKDWVQAPEEKFKQWFIDLEQRGEKSIPNYPTVEASCEIVDWQEKMHYIDDATGICAGLSSFPLKPPFHIHNLPELISAGAGIEVDEPGLVHLTRRNRNLVRANNLRRGLTRADEKPPEDHWKKRFPDLEKKLLDEYYKFKGWNNDGIPTLETLHELDLDYVGEDFVKRGILAHEKKPSPQLATSGGRTS